MSLLRSANLTVKTNPDNDPAVRQAYADYERRIYIRHLEVGCYLVMTLMPLGVVLDFFVYPQKVGYFFKLRLLSAVLGGVVWLVLQTGLRERFHRYLSLVLALLPAFFICWMIYDTEGVTSTYYAGLNLILLAVALVMRWSADLNIAASGLVISMYLGACLLHGSLVDRQQLGVLINNLYFITLTAIIVAVSGWIHQHLRFNEFTLNYQLDQNQRDLAASNVKLSEQNAALARVNREIKEAEAQLVQAEKMSSLGRFSAGLMHDVLNPLNYVRTAAFTLHKRIRHLPPERQPEFTAILTDIEDGLKRVSSIVTDLRTFTHPGDQAADLISLLDVSNVAMRFVSNELKEKNFEMEVLVAPQQVIWFSRNHFILVLVNLLENAIDALEADRRPDRGRPSIKISSRSAGERCLISVRDNGPGISPDIMPKIFDPFFTTKEVGKGTGLGLSICFGILRGYGGNISVSSEPGRFTEFTLDLPATETAAAQARLQNAEPIRI
jgi:two-component system, sensor histidine kinase PhcS